METALRWSAGCRDTFASVKTGQPGVADLEPRGDETEACLRRFLTSVAGCGLIAAFVATDATVVLAQEGFPFGSELTLDAAPMRGSKRIPNLEIGRNGDVIIELWCKGARGQFAVANGTIVFVPGAVEDRGCPADRAAADDALLAALASAATWRRQGDTLVLAGSRQLRFRMHAN
jgi:heat shock protein HslJ